MDTDRPKNQQAERHVGPRADRPVDPNGRRPAPRRIVSRTIPEQIAERVGAEIVAGRRAEGERLIETDLAEGFGVSRGPIREALRILERRHLVDIVPRRGAYVKAASLNAIADLFNTRMALSALAVRLMASAQPASYLETLARRVDELRSLSAARGVDPVDFAYVVTRAIRTIARGSGNTLVVDLMSNLDEQTVWTTIWKSPLDYTTRRARQDAVRALASVLDAVRAGDGAAAESALRAFLEGDRDQAIRVLSKLRGEKVERYRLLRTGSVAG